MIKKLFIITFSFMSFALVGMKPEENSWQALKRLRYEISNTQKDLAQAQDYLVQLYTKQNKALAKDMPLLRKREELAKKYIANLQKYLLLKRTAYNDIKKLIQEQEAQDSAAAFLKKTYPKIYAAIPFDYAKYFIPYINKLYKAVLQNANQSTGAASAFVWNELTKALGLGVNKIYNGVGYTFFDLQEITKPGKFTYHSIHDIGKLKLKLDSNPKDINSKKQLETLTGQYKIHLMPHRIFIPRLVIKLIKAIKQDPSLADVLYSFKVRYPEDAEKTVNLKDMEQSKRVPRIVIYLADGKANAQKALKKLIVLFKNDISKGIDITPRFNQKVNPLIYFAQSDADTKYIPFLQHYFEQPEMIYYVSDITGEKKDYRLYF